MSRVTYEQLLAKFRAGWNSVGQCEFNLEVSCPSRISILPPPYESEPPYDFEHYELLATVCVPVTRERKRFSLFGYAVLRNDATHADTRATFKALCSEAGTAMPPEFRDRLSGYCPWHVTQPASWWVALLLHVGNHVGMSHDGRYREHHPLVRPFLLSVDAIERCRLNTDQPDFPFGSFDPVDYLLGFSGAPRLFPSEAARLRAYLKTLPTGQTGEPEKRRRLQDILDYNVELERGGGEARGLLGSGVLPDPTTLKQAETIDREKSARRAPLAFDEANGAAIPAPPSSLSELPAWIEAARELLRGQEDQLIEETGIACLVRKLFMAHLETLFPTKWANWYFKLQPYEFRRVGELVAMMALVESSITEPEDRQDEEAEMGFHTLCSEKRLAADEAGTRNGKNDRAWHGDGFLYVYWYGIEHNFSKTQGACVGVLWDAWENKAPVVSEEAILEKAGSSGSRLRDVFKMKDGMHPAWDTMIFSAGKGRFRLKEPEKSQPPGKPQENPT